MIEDMLNATTPEGSPRETTWAEFVADNAEDEETLDAVRSFGAGESALLGGGAQPITRITRSGLP